MDSCSEVCSAMHFLDDGADGSSGHNCVWHQQLPSWVTSGNFNAATLTSIIQTHCGTLVGHYKGQV